MKFKNLSDGTTDGVVLFYMKKGKLHPILLNKDQADILDLVISMPFSGNKMVIDPNPVEHATIKYMLVDSEGIVDDKLMSLYESLKIPQHKIDIETRRKDNFMGFPFFLRKEDYRRIEAVTIDEYPKAKHLIALYPYKRQADEVINIDLFPEVVESFLQKGFVWLHESEIDTMW